MVMIQQQEQHSVQEFEPKDSIGVNSIWFSEITRIGTLPAWGLHGRDRELRELYRNPYNWLGQSAVAAVIRKVKATPWQIKAGRNNVSYFQDVLQQAQFSKGWGEFISRLLLDFLTADYGAYIEIIGRGNPSGPIKGRVVGIAALDTLRCVPTGNLTYPVVYYSRRTNKLHRLHYTRVSRIVDMPDGDESRHMAGLSSMSRAVSMIEQQIPLNKYIAGTFDNLPPIGIFYNNANMNDETWKAAWTAFKSKLQNGATGMLTINNGESGGEIGGEFLRFASTPDGFDYEKYTEIAVNAYAAAFGIDRQDIYPLTGKVAGTATQSEILHEKARGMAFGDILSTIERVINNFILPANAEFSFEYRDEEKDIEIATRDNMLMDISQKMFSQGIPNDAILRYLAQMSETFRDVLTDEHGEIIELPDDDKKPVGEIPDIDDIVVDDNSDESPEESNIGTDSESKALDMPKEAYAYVPLGNEEQIVQVMRLIKSVMPVENVIEWQAVPTFHVTLCYAKDVLDSVVDQIANSITLPESLWIDAQSLETFETPDGYALHLVVEKGNDLKQLQASVYGAFAGGADEISDFSVPTQYKPHITLGYLKQNIGWQGVSVDIGIKQNPTKVIIARDDYDPVAILTANHNIKTFSNKAIQATRLDFENRFDDFLADARAGMMDRRRANTILRGMLRTFGNRAFRDGLEDGGVDPTQMDVSDETTVKNILFDQSQYVSSLTDVIFNGNGVTDAMAAQKAAMWFNKSISPFYDAGLKSADKNGMYEFVLGNTEEHCKTCKMLSGQVHRLKLYLDSGLYPQSDKLECGGWHCDCRLVKSTRKASGRLPYSLLSAA